MKTNMKTEINWTKNCQRRVMGLGHVPDYDQIPEYRDLMRKHGLPGIFENFDPKSLVRELKKTHAQAFWFYSKDHQGNAFYPSKVGHVLSVMKGRDFFGELVDACLSEDIVPLCVYEFSDKRMPIDHPDWCHRVIDDREINGDMTDAVQGARMRGPCLNGPYGDFVIEQTIEVLKEYPVKGYYVDFLGLFGFGEWDCPYCASIFKKDLGFEFSGIKNMTHEQYVKYVKWHYIQNDNYAKKLRKVIKDIRPDVAFTHNFHGNSNTVNMQRSDFAARNCDFITGDLFQFREGLLPADWKMRQYSALKPEQPAEALLDSVPCMGGDFSTVKAYDSYKAELFIARSLNVATCVSTILSVDGQMDLTMLTLNKKLYKEVMEYEPWLDGMKRISTVGLVRSHCSIEFNPKEKTKSFTPESRHAMEFEGWVQVLIASHQLWDVVSEHQITPEYLKQFKVLILPNVSCMSKEQVAAVEDFVKKGGKLIASGDTSLCNEDGIEQKNFQLSSIFGVSYNGSRKINQKILKLTSPEITPSASWESDALYFEDGQLSVTPNEGVEILGYVSSNIPLKGVRIFIESRQPGLTSHSIGKGKCIYFSGTPGFHYRLVGQNNIKQSMKRILQICAASQAPVELDAPESVELFAHEQISKNNLVVNLVNTFGCVSRPGGSILWTGNNLNNSLFRFDEIEEMPKIAEVSVRIRKLKNKTVKNIFLAPDCQKLKMEDKGGYLIVKIKNISVYGMIVVEYN